MKILISPLMTYDALRLHCQTLKGSLLFIKTFPRIQWMFINDGGPVSRSLLETGLITVRDGGLDEWTGGRMTFATLTPAGVRMLRRLCATAGVLTPARPIQKGDRFEYEGIRMKVDVIIDADTVRLYAPLGFRGFFKTVKTSDLLNNTALIKSA